MDILTLNKLAHSYNELYNRYSIGITPRAQSQEFYHLLDCYSREKSLSNHSLDLGGSGEDIAYHHLSPNCGYLTS